ncbi:hypothetical protein [Staphylococcus sp. HMSC070A02]|uniref:hypothetical protein n=1 Tax=Staphylococcus TaxID=1279 RepID=UPI0035A30420
MLNVFSIAMLLFSCDPFFLGKDLRDTPNYLVISSIVEIIVILLDFVPLFFKKHPVDYSTFLKSLRISTGITICSYYNVIFIIYNIFFIVGKLNNYKLFGC